MIVKLNLLVFCGVTAVLINIGECSNCDDVLKCVTNWVGDAVSPHSNVTLDYIEDTSANTSTSDKSKDNNDNLLTDLTRFLVHTFSSLIKEGPVLKSLGENTNIYVQTIKINESISDNKPIIKEDKADRFQNNNSASNINDDSPIHILQIDNITNTKHTNFVSYMFTADNQKFNNNLNTSATIQPASEITTTNYENIEINRTDIPNYGETIDENLEHTTYSLNDFTNLETVTTYKYSKAEIISNTNKNLKTTTEMFFEAAVTSKVVEKNNSGIDYYNEINSTKTHQLITYNISEKINIKDNYVDDTNELYGNNENDINELTENLTDYLDIDYVDMYKDTTNEDVQYTPVVYIPTTTTATNIIIEKKPTDKVDSVYPWIATVFVMNDVSKQFEYICDGSLLSDQVVLTAARCLMKANVTVDANNILIIVGKRSLQSTGPNEKVLRVKTIKIHDNFVSDGGKVDNDLAIAVLAEAVVFNIDVQPAPLGVEDKSAPLATATTGWHVSGPLQPLYLARQSTEDNSKMDKHCKNLFCATLGDSETTCPSYGGLFVERQADDRWRLKGIASGSPTSTGVCFNKDLTFTKIGNYLNWIEENMQETCGN